jgi:hypothetical protein
VRVEVGAGADDGVVCEGCGVAGGSGVGMIVDVDGTVRAVVVAPPVVTQ